MKYFLGNINLAISKASFFLTENIIIFGDPIADASIPDRRSIVDWHAWSGRHRRPIRLIEDPSMTNMSYQRPYFFQYEWIPSIVYRNKYILIYVFKFQFGFRRFVGHQWSPRGLDQACWSLRGLQSDMSVSEGLSIGDWLVSDRSPKIIIFSWTQEYSIMTVVYWNFRR